MLKILQPLPTVAPLPTPIQRVHPTQRNNLRRGHTYWDHLPLSLLQMKAQPIALWDSTPSIAIYPAENRLPHHTNFWISSLFQFKITGTPLFRRRRAVSHWSHRRFRHWIGVSTPKRTFGILPELSKNSKRDLFVRNSYMLPLYSTKILDQ